MPPAPIIGQPAVGFLVQVADDFGSPRPQRLATEPARAAQVHPRYRTPHRALLYTLRWSSLLVVSGTFDRLTDLVIFARFLFYGLIAVAVLKLKGQGKLAGPARGYPFLQILLLLFALTLLVNTILTQPKQSVLGLGLMATSLPFYAYFSRQAKRENSRLLVDERLATQ